jgi:twinkle protein
MLCNRSTYHRDGESHYVHPTGEDFILSTEINGKIRYTTQQYQTLLDEGKINSPYTRSLAMSGMSNENAYYVMNDLEREEKEAQWDNEIAYFNKLKVRSLEGRKIKGLAAKVYNVHCGVDEKNQVERHYYPRYDNGVLTGAKCRTLPKDFTRGNIGKLFGNGDLFGMNTTKEVVDSGVFYHTLVLTGGECDAMAAFQMISESNAKNSSYAGKLAHVWSPMKGEKAVEEFIHNKDHINKFSKILLAFDDDETGKELTKTVSRLFRGKCQRIVMPVGCKDPNDCIIQGKAAEFCSAYFSPQDTTGGGKLRSVSSLIEKAKEMPTMGKSWPWPSLNPLTFGMREHSLYIWGAGSGVGKTETTKEVVFQCMRNYDEIVGVIYLEEPNVETVRSFAGKIINKRLQEPPINNPREEGYSADLDYTEEQSTDALNQLEALDSLIIADTGGEKDIDTVMTIMNEMVEMGIKTIVLDNLTAIEMKQGKGSKVEAIDDAMRRIGTFKDEKPITIHLVSHLKRGTNDGAIPHEEGGTVSIGDFRGSGSISFWANVVIGIERDTMAMTDEAKRMTTLRIVKSRIRGVSTGKTIKLNMNPNDGRLLEVGQKAEELI